MAYDQIGGLVLETDDEDFIPMDQYLAEQNKETPNGENNNQKEAEESKPDEGEEFGESRQTEPNREQGGDQGQGSPEAVSPITSTALKLRDIGALRTLGEEEINAIKTENDLDEAFDKEVMNRTEGLKKQIEALRSGLTINEVDRYEQAIKYYNETITEDVISDEGENGQHTRQALLMYQCKLKGIPEEDAKTIVENSFSKGNDVEDAKKALDFCRGFFQDKYDEAIKNAAESRKRNEEANRQRTENLKKTIAEDQTMLKVLDVDKSTRDRIFEYIAKPTEEDLDENGKPRKDMHGKPVKVSQMTKFIRENPDKAHMILAAALVLSEEGKNFDKLFSGGLNKAKKEAYQALEDSLNGTRRKPSGEYAGEENGANRLVSYEDLDKGDWHLA